MITRSRCISCFFFVRHLLTKLFADKCIIYLVKVSIKSLNTGMMSIRMVK